VRIIYQGFSLLAANPEVLGQPLIAGIAARGKATRAQVVFTKTNCRTQARCGSGRSRPWSSRAIDNLKAHGVSVYDKYLPKYAQRTARTQSILASA
jgi:hypothetical protein